MDYILNWIDTNSLIISKNTSFINDLIEWRRSIENDLYGHVKDVADEYIANYDWSEVPQFDTLSRSIATKADKTIPVAADSIALLDVNGNIKDSEKKISDFVGKVSGATSGNLAGLDSDGNVIDSGKKPADFAPASGSTEYAAANHNHDEDYAAIDHNHDNEYALKTHTHYTNAISGLDEYLAALLIFLVRIYLLQ